LTVNSLLSTFWRRFIFASVLWAISWPILWFFKIGDITGPKAWFWVIGELSYPIAAAAYLLLDGLLANSGLKPWQVFAVAVVIITACMPVYYQHIGFVLGVSLHARLF